MEAVLAKFGRFANEKLSLKNICNKHIVFVERNVKHYVRVE